MGMRRSYLLTRRSVTHSSGASIGRVVEMKTRNCGRNPPRCQEPHSWMLILPRIKACYGLGWRMKRRIVRTRDRGMAKTCPIFVIAFPAMRSKETAAILATCDASRSGLMMCQSSLYRHINMKSDRIIAIGQQLQAWRDGNRERERQVSAVVRLEALGLDTHSLVPTQRRCTVVYLYHTCTEYRTRYPYQAPGSV